MSCNVNSQTPEEKVALTKPSSKLPQPKIGINKRKIEDVSSTPDLAVSKKGRTLR